MAELKGGSTSGNQEIVTQNSRPILAGATVTSGNDSYILYGPNASWGGKLVVGATTNKIDEYTAQVIVTGGDLHLDSGTNDYLYLNYYSQRPIVAKGGIYTAASGGYEYLHTGNIGSQTVANAGYATSAGTASSLSGFYSTNSSGGMAIDNATTNGHYYVNGTSGILGAGDGACYVQAYNTSWVGQIYQDYRTGQIALRGKNDGTWQSWRTVIDSGSIGSQTVANAGNSTTVGGLSVSQLFNNMGNTHVTFQDFNDTRIGFGFTFIQNTTNGPGIGNATQYYSVYTGLGNDYNSASYGMQLTIPRYTLNGGSGYASPYLCVRTKEGGSWQSWTKIYAGYADSTYSASYASYAYKVYKNGSWSGTNDRYYLAWFDGANDYSTAWHSLYCTSTLYYQCASGILNAQSFQANSSREVKENITVSKINALSVIKDVFIVDYNYKSDPDKYGRTGFIAEDTHKLLTGKDGLSLDVNNCIGVLIKAVQELTDEVSELRRICNRWQ